MDIFYVPFCDGLTSITLIVFTIEQQIKVCVRQIIDNTSKYCHYYSIQVYDNSNMVFRKQLRSMTAPRTVQFYFAIMGEIVYYRNKYRLPGSSPLYLLKVHVSKRENKEKSSKIRNPINNVSRYLKDISKIALHLESKKTQMFYK